MAIVWDSNRIGDSYPNRRHDRDFFQEHAQSMSAFCLAHPKNWKQWGQNGSGVQGGLLALTPIRTAMLARYSPN